MARERIVKIPLHFSNAYDYVVTKPRSQPTPTRRGPRPNGAAKVYSSFHRALNRLRTVDIDRLSRLPKSVTVVSSDEFGPLVIAIADATVFPDSSVYAKGRWFMSARFGLLAPRRPSTGVLSVDTECAVVVNRNTTQRDLVETVGPRLATLCRTRPGLPALVPTTRYPLTQTLGICSLTSAGVILDQGAARSMPSALFARLPVADDRDGQKRRFAELFQANDNNKTASVYLESDTLAASPEDAPSIADVRLSYELSGSQLVAANQFTRGDIARLGMVVAGARELILETEDLRPFARFAHSQTPVSLASPPKAFRRNALRRTATTRFEMDDALRTGAKLPPGVELLSRPNYDVLDTPIGGHRVYVDGTWRAQADNVLVEHSLGPWVLAVRNAIVAPNGSVMLEDGTQLGGAYFGEIPNAPQIDGWIIDETARPSGLGLTQFKAFGHGLLQVAPRVDALMQHDPTMDFLIPDFTWDVSFLLQRVGVDFERIHRVSRANHHHLVRVPELIVSTHLHPESTTARADSIWQSDFVSRFVGATTPPPSRRIFFGRQDESGVRGGCVNRSVLSDIAEEFGYETVYPELLSFDEQVELVASTIDVFGEHGSALNWSLYMPSGSRTVLVNGKAPNSKRRHASFQNPVLAARGSRYRELNVARAGQHSHFEVDPRELRKAMETLP